MSRHCAIVEYRAFSNNYSNVLFIYTVADYRYCSYCVQYCIGCFAVWNKLQCSCYGCTCGQEIGHKGPQVSCPYKNTLALPKANFDVAL